MYTYIGDTAAVELTGRKILVIGHGPVGHIINDTYYNLVINLFTVTSTSATTYLLITTIY